MTSQLIDVAIDRSSPVPLYHQLAEQLSAAIVSGRLQPGEPFENELDLCQRMSLSRPTVRRAIQELVDQGLVVRRRAVGTTVANRKVHRTFELSSLYDDLARAGRSPQTRVLEFAAVTDARAAAALDLPEDAELLHVLRLRLVDDVPLALLSNWLPPSSPALTVSELESKGLYDALRQRGAKPVVARQSIGARMPAAVERKHLGLRRTAPVLTMTRMAFDIGGTAIEYGRHSYRTEDFELDMVLDER